MLSWYNHLPILLPGNSGRWSLSLYMEKNSIKKINISSSFFDHFQFIYLQWNCLCFKCSHFCHFYFEIFIFEKLVNFFSGIFLSAGIVTSDKVHVCYLKFSIIMSGWFTFLFLSVWTNKTGSGVCLYHFFECGNTCISVQCMYLLLELFGIKVIFI